MSTPEASLTDPSVVRLRDPGELVAAVPVLLRFHPRDSLVLISTGGASGRRLGLTLRIDLPPPQHDARVAADSVEALFADPPAGAAVLVIGTRPGPDPTARSLVDRVVRRLGRRRVVVHTVARAQNTTAGTLWHCYGPCRCRGRVPDPDATPIAAAGVLAGQVVFAERADLQRLVDPPDPARIRRRERLLIDGGSGAGPDPGNDATQRVVRGTAIVEAALADVAAGRLELDDARVLALATALTVPAVRDVAMLHCAGERAASAEQLWAALCRETPDPEAVEPAALLAVCALLRGDGALANVALARGQRARPGHALTGMLRAVADVGVRPGLFRTWVTSP